MPWANNDPEKRRRDAKIYNDPVYKANRAIVMRNAGGRCDECHRGGRRLACDHIIPVTQGGGHHLGNLQALCTGPGSCHARKTAAQSDGGGYRKGSGGSQHADPEPRPRTAW